MRLSLSGRDEALEKLADNREIRNMCKPFKWDDSNVHPLLWMNGFFKKYSKNPDFIKDIHSDSDSTSPPPDLNLLFAKKKWKWKPLPKVILKKPIKPPDGSKGKFIAWMPGNYRLDQLIDQ